jgi:ABC-type lipoprotein release transport system permease subunit
MTWRLVFRNIVRNRKNSFIIFLLIMVITALFFIGNSIIGQTNTGLRKTYIDSLTADVIIQKKTDMSMNLFGANSPVIDNYVTIPVLPAYENITEIISSEKGVEQYTSQVSGMAALKMPEISDKNEGVPICGIDPESYFNCFPGITIEEGRFLENGEYGAMITTERAKAIEQETGIRPSIGTPMLFSSAGTVGFKIREVPMVGIYRYENPGQFMNEIVITDPQTARVLLAVQVASAAVTDEKIPDDPMSIFNEGFTYSEAEEYEGVIADDIFIFDDSPDTAAAETELSGGDWNFLLLRLKQGISASGFINSLNKKLAPFNAYATGWRTAAGTSAIMMLLVQTFFNLGGFMVSIAGVIVVVNILLIAVFRRTTEIGTLKAIGASDSYIRFLIMGENCIIALLAGIVGVLAGIVFLRFINSMHIVIPNDLIAALLGGKVLSIIFFPLTAFISFCIALVLGAAASIYPVETAVRIDPVTAVRQG